MKRSMLYVLAISAIFIVFTAETMSDDGRAGAVGSPGENTCNTTMCHNSFTLNSGGGSVSATSTMNNWTYDPLTSYSISIKVAKTGVGLFGVGAEILTSSNTNAGTIVVSDAVHTAIKSAFIGGVARRSLVHKLNGGASQDSMIFTFNWTSPDTTAGPVTMYFCGNATNANNSALGDYIYSSTQVITPASGNHISEFKTTDSFSAFPNPAKDFITIHYTLQKNEHVVVSLYNSDGRLVKQLLDEFRFAGVNDDKIALPNECSTGIYYLGIISLSGKTIRKILIEQ